MRRTSGANRVQTARGASGCRSINARARSASSSVANAAGATSCTMGIGSLPESATQGTARARIQPVIRWPRRPCGDQETRSQIVDPSPASSVTGLEGGRALLYGQPRGLSAAQSEARNTNRSGNEAGPAPQTHDLTVPKHTEHTGEQ